MSKSGKTRELGGCYGKPRAVRVAHPTNKLLCPTKVVEAELRLRLRLENGGRALRAQLIGRVDDSGFWGRWNASAVAEVGSGGACRLGHGPRVVIVPVIAAIMAA